jgi:hypothetical protein
MQNMMSATLFTAPASWETIYHNLTRQFQGMQGVCVCVCTSHPGVSTVGGKVLAVVAVSLLAAAAEAALGCCACHTSVIRVLACDLPDRHALAVC